MKSWKLPLCALLVAALLAIPLAGCSGEQAPAENEDSETTEFSYSNNIDDNGYWKDVKASDYVQLADSLSIDIPKDTYEITDDEVQAQVDSLVSGYASAAEVTDRAVEDGDTVNIDYVGSIDGVEFSGGNTNGEGAEVTIGVTSYIDDFLQQLIGHMPGETFAVEVTFPDDYQTTDLAGKDAVFETTINYISEPVDPELNDAFVQENLSESYGWTTVDEMKAAIKQDLSDSAVNSYLQEHLTDLGTVSSVPDSLVQYQKDSMIAYYEEYASYYGSTMEDFLSSMGMGSVDELIESQAESNEQAAQNTLIVQAIAEKQGFSPTDEDVKAYFSESMGTDDYSQYEEQYGMPYLKQIALSSMVQDYLIENANFAAA